MMNSTSKDLALGLQRISDNVNVAVTALAVVLFVVMFSLSLVATFYQFILGAPLTWAYSLTRLFLPWIAMLSVTVAFKHGEHIGITIAIRHLPRGLLRLVQLANLGVVAFFGAALLWYGLDFFEISTQVFMVSDNLQVSHKWTAASVPLAGLVICIHLLSGVALVQQHEIVAELDLDEG